MMMMIVNSHGEAVPGIKKKPKLYYFDTEAQSLGEHVCNVIVVQSQDGEEEHVFYGDNAISDFTSWYLENITNHCGT